MISEHLHFYLANHACVSHLLRGQPHLLECYYRNCLIGTHMYVHPVSEWSVFFTLQCDLFTSCNASNNASLVSARTGGGGVVNQMWTSLNRGRGTQKFPNLCGHPLWMTPYQDKLQKGVIIVMWCWDLLLSTSCIIILFFNDDGSRLSF